MGKEDLLFFPCCACFVPFAKKKKLFVDPIHPKTHQKFSYKWAGIRVIRGPAFWFCCAWGVASALEAGRGKRDLILLAWNRTSASWGWGWQKTSADYSFQCKTIATDYWELKEEGTLTPSPIFLAARTRGRNFMTWNWLGVCGNGVFLAQMPQTLTVLTGI